MKTSGQLGLKIFGNRSYGQQVAAASASQKSKSGYYITFNFFGTSLTLIRFGWISHSDWLPQRSQTGQMAGLSSDVYKNKLIPIHGDYQLSAPIQLLSGVGPHLATELVKTGVQTVKDLLVIKSNDPRIIALQTTARSFLGK